MFRRGVPIAGGAGLGATVPDAIGGAIDSHDEGIRDDTAREIIGGIMDAQEQESRARSEQESIYMQGATDAAEMMLGSGGAGYGAPDDGGYGDYLGSSEGMYSLAAAMTVKGPAVASGLKAPKAPTVKPPAPPAMLPKFSAADALADVPGVLAEALGLDKQALGGSALGAIVGGTAGAVGADDLPSGIRRALLGAALGGAGGHIVGNPATRNTIAGMFKQAPT
jgi:hypothetical protein